MIVRILLLFLATYASCSGNPENTIIQLPDREQDSGITLVEAIDQRRSIRIFTKDSITLPELVRILHSAQGITSERGFRAAPSAGATYPLSVFVIAENVDGLEPGIYRFHPRENSLMTVRTGNFLHDLALAALGQRCISSAPVAIAIVADYSITTSVYGDRGVMYVHMEAGHVSQNIYLQCTAIELGTVAIGAFTDNTVAEVLGLEENETPLYIMPVGRP
ncbi:MAG: SagB/ThcOx family dehydrogenase [Candidatus Aegiribacteria sp.]|nr:SagB/ThcOx family dehydrogenase [Candidatus Aegiribacteria sp.]